jgi:ATP-dependent helicase/nuclease subunit A
MMQAILQEASKVQHQATVEGRSVWVSASAGTGKTYVLTNRILKLLLTQPHLQPSEILAVTYTKAAAKEMENRLRKTLAEWAMLDNASLVENLESVLGTKPTPQQQARAKELLFSVLEDGKGLNISTIHGFCQQILGAFPLESGISVGFSLLEGTEEREMILAIQDAVFQLCEDPETEEHQWFNYLVQDIHELTLRDVFRDIVYKRRKFHKLFEKFATVENILAELSNKLGIENEQWTPEKVKIALSQDMHLPKEVQECAEVLNEGGATVQKSAADIVSFVQADDPYQAWANYSKIFLTASGEPRKKLTDAKVKKHPRGAEVELILNQEQERVLAVEEKRKSYRAWLLTAAYLHLGYKMIDEYKTEKARQSLLDFDDLIEKTANLLNNRESKSWVKYRMDRKIAHVMLDEAQDIDDDQWVIIRALVDEFYDGVGSSELTRTLFAVGDVKQSIYRFRGAQPHVFGSIREYLEHQKNTKSYDTQSVSLQTSFRSSKTILNFVDKVFAEEEKQTALDNTMSTKHKAVKSDYPGWVEVWPLCEDNEPEEQEDTLWPLPIQAQDQKESARKLLSKKVADSIQSLIQSKTLLAATQKPATYGDIMILLRGRTMLPDIIEALNAAGVPHSGADRLTLNQDIMVSDILAFLRFIHYPQDSVSLAHVLRSPFFGVSEKALMETGLKARKENISLWQTLTGDTKNKLQEILEKSRHSTVYDMAVLILTQLDGYAKYFATLGQKDSPVATVTEPLEAFLEIALKFAKGDLAGFIHAVESSEMEFKKGLESAGKNVRIITSHGAKGLEAPVVYMPDTTQDYYAKMSRENLLWQEHNNEAQLFLYSQRKEDAPTLQQEIQQAEKDRIFADEMRLLYVALTRSQERLYIGGAEVKKKCPDNCWYNEISTVMDGLYDFGDAKVMHDTANTPIEEKLLETEEVHYSGTVPQWVAEQPAHEHKPVMVTADEALDTNIMDKDLIKLYRRGKLIHRLLEFLPDVTPIEHTTTGLDWLRKVLPDGEDKELNAMVKSATDVIQGYPQFFGENSKAEVGYVADKNMEGRIDRLVVEEDTITILDYKTDQKIPEKMPEKYRKQLQKYVEAVAKIFPEKQVKAAIIWVGEKEHRLNYL